ncbi:hypothetical protein TrRE_jg11899 [Triparma retinervis]|uniref:Uncharacterized protein n=1 Tax=Triparma retinervis TaxID=2557542 RepID=A0A9W7DPE6_9STRA|nr:hypothetical protein TrRE_jg11899 [Triparma retinervis]
MRFFLTLLCLTSALSFFTPVPRKAYVAPLPVFKRYFGKNEQPKKVLPVKESKQRTEIAGVLSPEELISEAKRLRDEASACERKLREEKLRQAKEALKECVSARGDDNVGGIDERVQGSSGLVGGAAVGKQKDGCDFDTIETAKRNVARLERELNGDTGGGTGGEGRNENAGIGVVKEEVGSGVVPKSGSAVDAKSRGGVGDISTKPSSSRSDAMNEIFSAAYSDLPGFLKPFVGSLLLEDKYNKTQSEEETAAEIQSILAEELNEVDELFAANEFFGNDTNATVVSILEELSGLEGSQSDLDMMVISTMPSSVTESSVSQEELELLQSRVLKPGTGWESQSKGEKVPGGWIIKGKWNRNVTFETIDKLLISDQISNFRDISVCYVVDPAPLTEDQIELGQEPSGVLYVTRKPIVKQSWLATVVTGFSLVSLAAFSLGGFALNDEVVRRLEAAQETTTDVGWLLDLARPIFLAVAAQQAAKDAGRILVSISESVKLTTPAIVPSLNFGLLGSVVKCKTNPSDRNALFDLGVVGPSIGIGVGMLMLILGLLVTSSAAGIDLSSYPRLPVSFLRSSALAGGLVDAILGDVLGGPDPNAAIAIHPLAVAGYAGIVTSALSALPIGNTDGGRVSLSVFGRSGASVVNGLCLFTLLIAGLFGSDVFLYYGAVVAVAQRELEVPCRDEVTEASTGRVVYTILLGCFAAMALLPLPISTPF